MNVIEITAEKKPAQDTMKEDILNTGWLISMQMRESPAPAWTSVTICIG